MNRAWMIPIYVFVFATGATGLIYEVTWQKYLSRLFGSDTLATGVIMGTFLGGLSLGYFLCGKLSTRVSNHFKAYALLEAVIAVWCFSFPSIFGVFASSAYIVTASKPMNEKHTTVAPARTAPKDTSGWMNGRTDAMVPAPAP